MNDKISSNYDVNSINKWHIFGLSNNTLLKKVTANNITLIGIIYKDSDSSAVFLINSKEFVFKLGDKIDNNYSIHKIEPSRIILATQDGLQEIELFQILNENMKSKKVESTTPEVENNINIDNQNNVPEVENIVPANTEDQSQNQSQVQEMRNPYARFKNY